MYQMGQPADMGEPIPKSPDKRPGVLPGHVCVSCCQPRLLLRGYALCSHRRVRLVETAFGGSATLLELQRILSRDRMNDMLLKMGPIWQSGQDHALIDVFISCFLESNEITSPAA